MVVRFCFHLVSRFLLGEKERPPSPFSVGPFYFLKICHWWGVVFSWCLCSYRGECEGGRFRLTLRSWTWGRITIISGWVVTVTSGTPLEPEGEYGPSYCTGRWGDDATIVFSVHLFSFISGGRSPSFGGSTVLSPVAYFPSFLQGYTDSRSNNSCLRTTSSTPVWESVVVTSRGQGDHRNLRWTLLGWTFIVPS